MQARVTTRSLAVRALLGTLLLAAPPVATATTVTEPLSLRDALDLALAANPDVRAAQARYRAMLERPIQEGTLPDPMVGVRYHNEEFNKITFGESEFTFLEFSAEQEVPFPGKLPLRAEIAAYEANREGAMRDATILTVLAQVAVTHADLQVIDRSLAIVDESGAVLDLIREQASTSYAVGEAAQQDVLRAGIERDALREQTTMLEQKRVAAESAMNALLDRGAASTLPAIAWSDDLRPLAALPELAAKLAARAPELRAAEAEVSRSDAGLALARREYFPDFTVMGAYMNKDGLAPEWELGVKVKVPLYFWRRQRAAVAEAGHARTAATSTRRNAAVTLDARLRELHAMATAAQRLVELYRDRLIPQASLTLESARESYAVGRVDFLTVLSAFTSLLGYRMRYAEEVGNLRRAQAEIGPIIGETPLGEEVPRG